MADSTVLLRVLNCVRQNFSAGYEVTADSQFVEDLGFDDLDYVELAMAIEKEFAVEVPDEIMQELHTPGDYVRALESGRLGTVGWPEERPEPWPPRLPDVDDFMQEAGFFEAAGMSRTGPPSPPSPTPTQLAWARGIVDGVFTRWKASVGGTELRPMLAEAFVRALVDLSPGRAIPGRPDIDECVHEATQELIAAQRRERPGVAILIARAKARDRIVEHHAIGEEVHAVFSGCEGEDPGLQALFFDRGDAYDYVRAKHPDPEEEGRALCFDGAVVPALLVDEGLLAGNDFNIVTHDDLEQAIAPPRAPIVPATEG